MDLKVLLISFLQTDVMIHIIFYKGRCFTMQLTPMLAITTDNTSSANESKLSQIMMSISTLCQRK